MKKIFIAFLIGMVTSLAMVSVSADAVLEYNGLTYIDNGNDSVCVTGYIGKEKAIIIPEYINNKWVQDVTIKDNDVLEFVGLPPLISGIGRESFMNCSNLKAIYLSNDIWCVGDNAFYGTQLKVIYTKFGMENGGKGISVLNGGYAAILGSGNEKFTSAKIVFGLDNLQIAGDFLINDATIYGYYGDSEIVEIPRVLNAKTISAIGDYAFYYCNSIKTLVFDNFTGSIGENSFANCNNLCEIYNLNRNINSNFPSVSGTAFNNSSNLVRNYLSYYNVYRNDDWWYAVNILDTTKASILGYKGKDENVTIPTTINGSIVNTLGGNAFEGNQTIKTVRFSDRLTNLGLYTFKNCTNLRGTVIIPDGFTSVPTGFLSGTNVDEVILPDSITSIAEAAFQGANISDISLPGNLEYIGKSAFAWTKLRNVFIPKSVKTIASKAFEIQDLYQVFYEGSVDEWNLMAVASDYLYSNYNRKIYYNVLHSDNWYYYIDNNAAVVCGYSGNDETVTIPNTINGFNVESLAEKAFINNSSVKCVKLPYTVKNVGNAPFQNCSSLESIYAPACFRNNTYNLKSEAPSNVQIDFYCTVKYMVNGKLSAIESVDYANSAEIVPYIPAEYLGNYKLLSDNSEWDGTNIVHDVTVNIVKMQNAVTYTGEINKTDFVPYGENASLPKAPIGYVYMFTVLGNEWNGLNITNDTEVLVIKLCSLSELNIDVADKTTIGTRISFDYYNSIFPISNISVSENASYKIYNDAEHTMQVDIMPLNKGINTFYIQVIAENGNATYYTVAINRDIPDSLGAVSLIKRENTTVTFALENSFAGTPTFQLFYGESKNALTKETTITYNSDNFLFVADNLTTDSDIYVCIAATYDDITVYSDVLLLEKVLKIEYVPSYCFYDEGKCYYKLSVTASKDVTGTFVIAFYDENGKMLGFKFYDISWLEGTQNESEKVTTTIAPAFYKVFVWKNMQSMMPISDVFTDNVE